MGTITEDFQQRITQTISEIEQHTSIEFVPYIARVSSDYWAYVLGWISLMLTVNVCASSALFWWLHPWIGAFSLTFSPILFALIQWSPTWWIRTVPLPIRQHEVEQAAYRVFLREEVFSTRQRTGVLIYVSVLEQAVFIVADKGISAKVPSSEWATLGATLAKDFSKKSPGDTFLKALQALSERLVPEFPPHADNPNELPDHVRSGLAL